MPTYDGRCGGTCFGGGIIWSVLRPGGLGSGSGEDGTISTLSEDPCLKTE